MILYIEHQLVNSLVNLFLNFLEAVLKHIMFFINQWLLKTLKEEKKVYMYNPSNSHIFINNKNLCILNKYGFVSLQKIAISLIFHTDNFSSKMFLKY